MKTERPVFLSLSPAKFHWPITALASIGHRVTGVVLFAGIGYLLWLLDLALRSEGGFAEAGRLMSQIPVKLATLFVLGNLIYHVIAGVKHLLLDFHIGESFEAASMGAQIVIGLTLLVTAAVGVWLW